MKKIRAAIVGYGNIGSYVLEALQAAPDFEVAGVVRRDATNVPAELKDYVVVSDIAQIKDCLLYTSCRNGREGHRSSYAFPLCYRIQILHGDCQIKSSSLLVGPHRESLQSLL